MRKYTILLFLVIGQTLFNSCDGEFVAAENAIFLSFPVNNEPCRKGTKIGDQIAIPFEWILNGDGLENLQIEIRELDSNKNLLIDEDPIIKEINGTQLEDNIPLDYGKWYEWKIVSLDTDLKSETFSFFSQGEPIEDTPPFPAEISIQSNNGGNIIFTWERPVYRGSSPLLYDVYFDQNKNPETRIKNNENEPVPVPLTDLMINSEYYIKVVTKENRQDGNSSIAIKKITINP